MFSNLKIRKIYIFFVYCAVDPVLDIRLSWRNFPSSTIVFLDEDNIPDCLTVDDDTLNNGTVTIRDRDTMEQITLKLEEVKDYVNERIKFQ